MKHDGGQVLVVIKRLFDQTAPPPLYRQLYELLRHMIVNGEVETGSRLPSTRDIGGTLGVSRHTVSTAMDQLVGEGYAVGRHGSGTYVSDHFRRQQRPALRALPNRGAGDLSARGLGLATAPRSPFTPGHAWPHRTEGTAFRIGLPAVDQFPGSLWARALAAAWREESAAGLGYQHPLGHRGLREEITTHLRDSLQMICQPEQVVIAAGSQSAVDLCYRLLVDPGEPVAMEDPGYLGARSAALASGARIVPVPVDADGMDVAQLTASVGNPRVVFVTPTHQFPLGVTMSLERRLALVAWAAQTGAWILEDDHDGLYRYGGRHLDPLAVLDRAGRVVYIGTFSTVMFPALRIGYMVIPLGLIDAFEAAHFSADIHRPALEQAALARFMREGHFAVHLRRSRDVHAERRQALLDAAHEVLDGTLSIAPAEAGLHLFAGLPHDIDDVAVAEAARRRGVDVWPLSIHNLAGNRRGLLLGYGAVPPALIRPALEQLEAAVHEVAG